MDCSCSLALQPPGLASSCCCCVSCSTTGHRPQTSTKESLLSILNWSPFVSASVGLLHSHEILLCLLCDLELLWRDLQVVNPPGVNRVPDGIDNRFVHTSCGSGWGDFLSSVSVHTNDAKWYILSWSIIDWIYWRWKISQRWSQYLWSVWAFCCHAMQWLTDRVREQVIEKVTERARQRWMREGGCTGGVASQSCSQRERDLSWGHNMWTKCMIVVNSKS